MNPLELPKQLEGKWKNAVFLTYGADLPFFERAIWRVLDKRCQNIIIIADGIRLLDSNLGFEESLDVRWANQKYIINGVFTSTFHSKMILLTSQNAGRLLVGSGNLGFGGYASGGEMFVQYDYNPKYTNHLSVFIDARDYLERLVEGEHLQQRTTKQINKIFVDSPWLYKGVANRAGVLRSNLERSFLEQFMDAIGDETVEELTILVPFYDEKALALKKLLEELKPDTTEILLQNGQTSIDPKTLEKIIIEASSHVIIRLVEKADDTVFLHNKMYVAKTASKSVCLQGSPNLSRSGFLTIPPRGNFELATMIVGEREEFDPLFEALTIHPTSKDVSELDLKYLGSSDYGNGKIPELQLLGAEWRGYKMTLFYKGDLKDFETVHLAIGTLIIPLKIIHIEQGIVEIEISQEAQYLLNHNFLVRFLWDENCKSKPIFAFNLEALDRAIEAEDGEGYLDRVGDFDLEDDELHGLLQKLERSLIIDRQSIDNIWRAANKGTDKLAFDEEGVIIDYKDIDYSLLRSHPKLAQYREWRPGGRGYQKTDLQIILSSITSHFQGLIETASGKPTKTHGGGSVPFTDDNVDQEDAEEVEADEVEREKQRVRSKARNRNVMKAFVRRYLKGISNVQFLNQVECDVIANNYVIFSHVLWRLYGLEWIEDDFVSNAFLTMSRFMWGDKDKKGYFNTLDEDGKKLASEIILKGWGLGKMIAAIFYSDYLLLQQEDKELRTSLQGFLRYYLEAMPVEIKPSTVVETWLLVKELFAYDPPKTTNIVERLNQLALWETRQSFLRSLEERIGLPKQSCKFSPEAVKVTRPANGTQVEIRQLEIDANGETNDQKRIEQICSLWMRFQPMDFYRVVSSDGKIVFLYDREFRKGLYVNRGKNINTDFHEIPHLSDSLLDSRLLELENIAVQANEKIEIKDFPVPGGE